MVLKTYNGFNHNMRMRALYWLRGEYAAGRRTRPLVCDACGQMDGVIEAHSENYSEPFGDHIGQHGLCYRCHIAIHTRFKNPDAWAIYKAHVREGRIFEPIGRSFYAFVKQTLTDKGEGVPFKRNTNPNRDHTLLDDIQ